jgi:hypothetical protein
MKGSDGKYLPISRKYYRRKNRLNLLVSGFNKSAENNKNLAILSENKEPI